MIWKPKVDLRVSSGSMLNIHTTRLGLPEGTHKEIKETWTRVEENLYSLLF